MRPSGRLVLLTGKAVLAAVAIHAGSALAQSYPAKPVHIVVAYLPGGALDLVARLLGQHMADTLQQAVIVDHRPGAGGSIGTGQAAKAAPDGYTVLLAPGTLAIVPALYRKLPFDAVKDFVPVSQVVAYPLFLMAGPKVPAASVGELIALAKSRPGKMNYGHTGVSSPIYLSMELLKLSTGIDILAIPYKGFAPIQIALTGGEVDVTFASVSNAVQWVKSGRARALGVSSPRRWATLPEVPTIAEAGVPGFEADSWQGLFVPAKTPRPVIGMIQQAAAKALNVPSVRARLESLGNEVIGSTPEEFDAKFKADVAKYAKIVREARIPAQD